MEITNPSYNISDTGLNGAIDFKLKQNLLQIEKAAPAKIISYDRNKNRAVCQILSYAVNSDGDNLTRKPLTDIPVANFGGGNFVLSFPVKIGDIGYIIASDGNISVFKKILDFFAPATEQRHKYKDGIFYPLIINGFTVNENDNNAVLLSSLDGTTKISLSEGKAEITAAQTIINGNLIVNGDISSSGTVEGQTVKSGNGSSGTYTNSVTSTNGIVTGGS